jgi:hypothetical protein
MNSCGCIVYRLLHYWYLYWLLVLLSAIARKSVLLLAEIIVSCNKGTWVLYHWRDPQVWLRLILCKLFQHLTLLRELMVNNLMMIVTATDRLVWRDVWIVVASSHYITCQVILRYIYRANNSAGIIKSVLAPSPALCLRLPVIRDNKRLLQLVIVAECFFALLNAAT